MGLLDLIGEKFAKDAQAKLDADAAARSGVLPQQNSQLLSNLRDFAQGASNSAAATVSAPVDGIAWLLRKAGVPVPAAPVGGSDWMAAQGLTPQPKNHTAGLLGEAVGGVVPIVAQAKAANIAKGLLQMGENAAAPTTLGKQAGAVLVDSKGGLLVPAAESQAMKVPKVKGDPFAAARRDLRKQFDSGAITSEEWKAKSKDAANSFLDEVAQRYGNTEEAERIFNHFGLSRNHPAIYQKLDDFNNDQVKLAIKGMGRTQNFESLMQQFAAGFSPQDAASYVMNSPASSGARDASSRMMKAWAEALGYKTAKNVPVNNAGLLGN